MKKTCIYLAILPLIAGIAVSCSDLESLEYSKVNSSLYPTTERDMLDLVTSNAYGAFRNNGYDGAFNSATGFYVLADMASDIGTCSWGDGNWGQLSWADFQNKTGDRSPTRKWGDHLRTLSQMEMTIDRIEQISGVNADLKTRSIAELECAQGFMGFLLWDWYGGLVIADRETLKNPQEVKILPRKTSQQTIEYIEGKLKSAINSGALVKRYDKGDANYGRFTEGLCHTLLLKLYMQTKQWDKAITEGRELMQPTYGYELVTTAGGAASAYANIFTNANEGNKETIWATNGLKDYQEHLWYDHTVGWLGYKMTTNFLYTFESGDSRADSSRVNGDGSFSTVIGINSTGIPALNTPLDGVFPLKYEVSSDPYNVDCYTDWIIFRYADVITLLAEALVQESGAVTQDAVDLLNQVRTRAGLAAYTLAGFSSKDDFIDKLLWERAHEFWFEGVRRQDLIRNNKYVAIMAAKSVAFGYPDNITALGENAHLFPLPDAAINEFKKGGIENQQNPGY